MRLIKSTDRILSFSHGDTDGATCQILLGNVFSNIYYINSPFGKIDTYLKNTDYSKFDHVFLTDLYPSDRDLINISTKLILIDHHDTQLDINNPKMMRFVDTSRCASATVKPFLESYFKVDLSYLNDLVRLTNDYDMWQLKYPESHMLNELYYYYKHEGFRNRFFKGNINFTRPELDYLSERNQLYKKLYESLDGIDFDSMNGCMVLGDNNFINEICHDLMEKDGYHIVFFRVGNTGRISVRHKIEGLHIGNLLLKLGMGGGHEHAAGMLCSKDPKELSNQVQRVIKEIYEKFPIERLK